MAPHLTLVSKHTSIRLSSSENHISTFSSSEAKTSPATTPTENLTDLIVPIHFTFLFSTPTLLSLMVYTSSSMAKVRGRVEPSVILLKSMFLST